MKKRVAPHRPFRSRNILVKLLVAIFLLGLLFVGTQRIRFKQAASRSLPEHVVPGSHVDDPHPHNPRHLHALRNYESLQYALDNSQLVALYFAASWCPTSTPVSLAIDSALSDMLLPPPRVVHVESLAQQRHGLSLVYVGSDKSEEEMRVYLERRPHWMAVPFDSPERARLKRHFQTAAEKELSELGMTSRRHEIPTLIVIDGASHQVLTFHGVKDVTEKGAKAVDEWFELMRISHALDAKFNTESTVEDTDDEEDSEE
jgi:hypothetical protein